MWISPNHPKTPKKSTAGPEETGEPLAVFRREKGVELRVKLDTYEGHKFVSLRVWDRGRDGKFWPCPGKGCSVRLSEAGELAEALARIAGKPSPAPEPSARDRTPSTIDPPFIPTGRQPRPDWRNAGLEPLGEGARLAAMADFDEFAEPDAR
jgi:hypothetical protein